EDEDLVSRHHIHAKDHVGRLERRPPLRDGEIFEATPGHHITLATRSYGVLRLERHGDRPLEIGEIEWLVDIGKSTEFKGLSGQCKVCGPTHHQYTGGRFNRAHALEYIDAGHVASQRNIKQHDVRAGLDEELEALITAQSTLDPVPFLTEQCDENIDHLGVVIDDEDSGG